MTSRLNALSGIGGVQTAGMIEGGSRGFCFRLNALSGIGGVQTDGCLLASGSRDES